MILFLISSAFICAASGDLIFNCSTASFSGIANEMSSESGSGSVYFSWKGRVPYFFSNKVIQQDKEFVKKQMDFIESNTCVKFIEQSQFSVPDHHLEIDIDPISCGEIHFNGMWEQWSIAFSAAVQVGGDQGLKVLFKSYNRFADKPHCNDKSNKIRGGVIHELFHAVGAIHTHQRKKDRDDYVTHNDQCLRDPGKWTQFNKVEFSMPTSDDIKYEFASIMHYGCDTHSVCKGSSCQCNTLQPKDGTSCSDLGSDLPTEMDWKMIREYQCNGESGTSSKPALSTKQPALPTTQPPITTWPSNNLPTWDWPNLPWFQIPPFFDPSTWYDIPTGPGASFCPYTDNYDPQHCAWLKRRCMMDADVSTNCAATCFC